MKILNIVKCKRNFQSEKRSDRNFIIQNLRNVKDHRIFEVKEPVKTISEGGYIWMYFGLYNGGSFRGWWWVVVYIFWLVVDGGG